MTKTAFVTGGTGFLGINLLRALSKSGWQVTALHRPSSTLTYIQNLPIQLVEGSITDRASLVRAIPAQTEVLFHLAGDTNQWSRHNARQTAINVDGTRHLVEVAREKGINTFIHTSSISAWGGAKGMITEETPQLGGQSWLNYEKSKWQGEREALKGLEMGLKVVIINPGSIVGAFDANTWAKTFFALRDGQIPGVPPGNNSFVHVQDVVQALILAVEKGQSGHRYLITGENTSFQDFVGEIAQVMGLEKVPSKLPGWLLKAFAHLQAFGAKFTGKEPTITPEIATFLSRKDYAFSAAKALGELGYQQTPWRQGVQECHDWLKQEGLL